MATNLECRFKNMMLKLIDLLLVDPYNYGALSWWINFINEHLICIRA